MDLLGRSADELRAWMAELGEPAYRGAQLYHALYAERRRDFSSMTNIPAALRARLESESRIGLPQIARRYQSADGSVRYLLSLGENTGARSGSIPSQRSRGSGLHAVRGPPDDLHFDAGGLRRGLPFLPDGTTRADSQSHRRRDRRAGARRAGRSAHILLRRL